MAFFPSLHFLVFLYPWNSNFFLNPPLYLAHQNLMSLLLVNLKLQSANLNCFNKGSGQLLSLNIQIYPSIDLRNLTDFCNHIDHFQTFKLESCVLRTHKIFTSGLISELLTTPSCTMNKIIFFQAELHQKSPLVLCELSKTGPLLSQSTAETSYFILEFPQKLSTISDIFPENFLCQIFPWTSIFLSQFISECHSLCQIQLTLHFSVQSSLENLCSSQNLLLSIGFHLLFSVRFYFKSFYFLSDFNSEATRFYNILHQNHLPSGKFYNRSSKFRSDFYTRNCKFLSDFTSETPNLFQILP